MWSRKIIRLKKVPCTRSNLTQSVLPKNEEKLNFGYQKSFLGENLSGAATKSTNEFGCVCVCQITLPQTKIFAPENGWWED